MSEMVYETARREARRVLQAHWDGSLPVRLTEITRALGASKYEADLGPALSGMVTKQPGTGARIALNSTHSAPRRRFTWAHELGHIIERRAVDQDDLFSFTDVRGGKYDLHEFFADEFAGALLMPADEIERLRQSGATNGQLAQTFGVSVDAVVRRLERLRKQPEESARA